MSRQRPDSSSIYAWKMRSKVSARWNLGVLDGRTVVGGFRFGRLIALRKNIQVFPGVPEIRPWLLAPIFLLPPRSFARVIPSFRSRQTSI